MLVAQDTSLYNFEKRTATRGLGPLSNRRVFGWLVHSALAIRTDGLPLGVLHQRMWAWDAQQTGKASERKQRQVQDKESVKWQQTGEEALDRLPEDTAVVSVSDREYDVDECFAGLRRPPAHLLVRATQDPSLQGATACLWERVRSSRCVGESGGHSVRATCARSASAPSSGPALRCRPGRPLRLRRRSRGRCR